MTEDRSFDVLSVSEVARFLHISDDSVRRRIADGSLTAFKFAERGPWRIPRFGLEKAIGKALFDAAKVAMEAASATSETASDPAHTEETAA